SDGNGISYRVDGTIAAGGTVRIVAALDSGAFVWETDLPSGWTVTSDGDAEYSVTLDDPDCTTDVTPVTPTVQHGTCAGTTPTSPTISVPLNGGGISYQLDNDNYDNGDRVTITATLDGPTYEWQQSLPLGWETQVDGTTTFIVQLDNPTCLPTLPYDPPGLARTGTPVSGIILGLAGSA